VFLLVGAIVSWASKKQVTLTLFSIEVKYMACTRATKEALWLKRFLGKVGYKQEKPTLIFLTIKEVWPC
jgi:hypothetical protein